MDLKRLTSKAKELVEKRGGSDSVKQDAEELKGIAKGGGSLSDKAKAAAAAIKDPGADGAAPGAEAASAAEGAGRQENVERERGGKRRHGGQGRGGQGRGGKGRGRRRDGSGDGDPAV